ncbi:RNA polymerase sigma-70 factor [Chitinophagaceae bacterium 26-R-25]|nr:RNA polymerase sigma-70 factor [Chitinophagaceae bacterium 26-R-25]
MINLTKNACFSEEVMCDKKVYNEVKLLSRIADSDHAAFREVFDHYRNKIFSIAYKMLKDEALAQDAVQDIFVKLWLHKEKLQGINNFNAYINTLTRNHLFNQLKRIAHAEKIVNRSENKHHVSCDSVTENIEYKEFSFQLAKCVNKLPPQQKKVYQLGKEEGMKYEEIAEQLHISKETVKTHMAEALRSIKSRLISRADIILWLIMSLSIFRIFFF